LLLTSILAVLAVQLNTAEFVLELEGPATAVEARYETREPFDALFLNVMRIPGQTFQLAPVGADQQVTIDTLAGLYRVRLIPTAARSRVAVVGYEIVGDSPRVPLAVPEIAAHPGVGRVTISLRGLDADVSLSDGFPRFHAGLNGSLVAELENVPGFVLLPPARGHWSVGRLGDVAVVLLVALASIYWLMRRRLRFGDQHSQQVS